MNKSQIKAIRQLETALKHYKKSGLALVGIDCYLLATVDGEELDAECGLISRYEAVPLETHGIYLGSSA